MENSRFQTFRRLKFWISIFILAILFISCASYKISGDGSWKFVYENDKEGHVVRGDINSLIDAVTQGKEVRVMIFNEDSENLYITEAENIWVRNNIVHIQNTSHS
jgi:hypothetical protein